MTRIFQRLPPAVQTWLLDHGWLFWVVLAVAGLIPVFLALRVYEIDAYVTADIVSFSDDTGDDGYIGRFVVQLPDGTRAYVVTTSPAVAARVGQDACIAVRKHRSGAVTYGFSLRDRCTAPD